MKRHLVVLVALSVIWMANVCSQTTIGPLLNDYRENVYKTAGGAYGGSGLVGLIELNVGRISASRYRCFFQWTLPDNVLPDGANISQVKLEFDITRSYGPQQAGFVFAPIEGDLTSATQQSLFDETENAPSLGGDTQTNHLEVIYQRPSAFISWVLNQLSENRFTLAIWMPTDYGYDYNHLIRPNTVKLTFWIDPVTVTADQVFEDLTTRVPNSSVGLYEGTSFVQYGVPHQFQFHELSTQTFDAQTSLELNQSTGMQEKYRTWNALPDVVNHKDFLILPGLSRVESQFKSSHNATLQGQLVDGGSSGGVMEFADPWLRDSSDTKGPLNRGTRAVFRQVNPGASNIGLNSDYKGVFLGENPSWLADHSNYSVGAPDPNSINNFTCYFQNWTVSQGSANFQYPANSHTGAVFNSQGTIITALYKAQLGSSISNATASNSQRVMTAFATSGSPDVYMLVYPSVGEIWRNYSFDAGATWWYDTRTSSTSGTSSAPSLAFWRDPECSSPIQSIDDYCHSELYVVYRRQDGNNYNIEFCIPPLDNSIPASTTISSTISTSIDTRPVIARLDEDGYPELWVFWQASSGINYNYATKVNSTWTWQGEQEAFGGNYRNPSISAPDLNAGTPTWYLTYDDGSDVSILAYPTYSVFESVPASVSPTSYASQVSADNRSGEKVHVVWEAYGGEQTPPPGTDRGTSWLGNGAVQKRRVMYQQWNGTSWQTAHEFIGSVSYYRPTISNLDNGHLAWAWDDGTNTYKALSTDAGSTWSVVETVNNTTQPNLTISASQGPIGTTRFVSTSTSGAPYRLSVGAETTRLMDGPKASLIPEQYRRRVVVAKKPPHIVKRIGHSVGGDGPVSPDSSSYVSVELLPITLKMHDGSVVSVDFTPIADSTADEQLIWSSLETVPITLSSAIDSIVLTGEAEAHSPLSLNGRELGISFSIVDADVGTVLRRMGNEQLFTTSAALNLNMRESTGSLTGHRVVLRPIIRGFAGHSSNLLATVVHVHELLDDSTAARSNSMSGVSESAALLPTTFALHQNFPNPFNPTTQIDYDLPVASQVSLVVYDVLGKEVANLVRGYHEAGYHSAIWNAADQASGMYLARFSVVDAEGKTTFMKVNKLILMK